MDSTRRVAVGDAEFCVSQCGEDPSAVFLHGFGDDLTTWDLLWQHLDPGLARIRYDLRGFGNSECKSETPYSHTDDLRNLLDAMGIQQVSLVGVSMGGSVALNFALDYPQRVKKLVLICPGLVAWEWSEDWRCLWRPILEAAKAGNMQLARELWWQHPLFAVPRESDGAALLHAAIERYSGRHWLEDNETAALPDVERLHQLAVATLLITGERDVEEFKLMADLIAAASENVRRVRFETLGHLPHIEDPAACAGAIQNFLQN